jgi:anti-anti-sigma factor
MRTTIRTAADITIIDCEGDLVAGVGDDVMRDAVDGCLAQGCRGILVNLSRVRRMDSAGIGELVAAWKRAGRQGVTLKLLRPDDRIRSTLHMSQLLPLIEVLEAEPEALASF